MRPYRDIAKEVGCSSVTVSVAMRQHEISKRKKCVISKEDYKLFEEGKLSKHELKEKYGYSMQTIRAALRRIK